MVESASVAADWLTGVDGCRGGWIAVTFRDGGRTAAMLAVHRNFADVVNASRGGIIAIDMPIGLPASGRPGGRAAEHAARALIGPRRHSIFGIPARAAVAAYPQGYAKVCEIAVQTSCPATAPSIQAFHIFPRIMEVDAALRGDKALARRVFEVHPELCFRLMHGRPVPHPKKRDGKCYEPGMTLRRELLLGQGYCAAFLDQRPPRGANRDDFFDACAAAWSAARIARGEALVLPEDGSECDEFGLPMRICG